VTAGAVATATWDEEACASDAGVGFSTATGVADALATAGVPFRSAHELVAEAAAGLAYDATVAEQAAALEAAAAEHLGAPLSGFVDEEQLTTVLSPAGSVAARDSQGGPAPGAVADSLEALTADYEQHADSLERYREGLAAAEATLATEVASDE